MTNLPQQFKEVLASVPATLRQLQEERDDALQKLATYQKLDRITKIANAMVSKGVVNDPVSDVVERLFKVANKELDVIEQAVDFTGPNMGEKFATVVTESSDTSYNGNKSLATQHFEQFIMS